MDDMLFLCDPDTGICGMEVKQKGPSWRGYEAGAVRSSQSGQMKLFWVIQSERWMEVIDGRKAESWSKEKLLLCGVIAW